MTHHLQVRHCYYIVPVYTTHGQYYYDSHSTYELYNTFGHNKVKIYYVHHVGNKGVNTPYVFVRHCLKHLLGVQYLY